MERKKTDQGVNLIELKSQLEMELSLNDSEKQEGMAFTRSNPVSKVGVRPGLMTKASNFVEDM